MLQARASSSGTGSANLPNYHPAFRHYDRLAEICGQYLARGQQVALEGRIQTRQWDDAEGKHHWKTEVVAAQVEMLSGRRKKDYAAETGAETLLAQAAAIESEGSSQAAVA